MSPPEAVSADNRVYRERLLNVARALRESPRPEAFSMSQFTHCKWNGEDFPCGTPMCAIGHYGARVDLQDEFFISDSGYLYSRSEPEPENVLHSAEKHFGLTSAQTDELFEMKGCGQAQTAEEAIAYIEAFVERVFPEGAR